MKFKKLLYGVGATTYLIATLTASVNAETKSVSPQAFYYDQDVTAYTAISGAKTYHGTTPTPYLTAAVHPNTCGRATSGTLLPYGTNIITSSPLYLPGKGNVEQFYVEDMGDVRCDRGFTRNWFDIYFGTSTTTNINNAKQFGKQKTDYYTL
ncbi:hypothetical protein [Brevibacillus brevis]|uniref:hypothetical protein n=1 Tax=Brevibacillus brevis TaxID=1393 RepID=UPI0025A5AD0B|nr:hypothetical protein [Brevibacillus brevis]WJQ79476.1 hypothetical protein QN310_18475 [Brevibacillus brevis]